MTVLLRYQQLTFEIDFLKKVGWHRFQIFCHSFCMKFLIFQKIYDNFYFKGYVDILVQVFKSKSNYMTTESESTLNTFKIELWSYFFRSVYNYILSINAKNGLIKGHQICATSFPTKIMFRLWTYYARGNQAILVPL